MRLTHKIGLYVPSESEGKPIEEKKRANALEEIEIHFSLQFGGCTTIKAKGSWVSEEKERDNKLIQEDIDIVYSYYTPKSTKEVREAYDYAYKLAVWLKEELKQEAVTIEHGRSLYII